MNNHFVLKDINFLEFKRVLQKNSAKYGYRTIFEKDKLELYWDYSPTATEFCVEIYPLGDKEFFYVIRMDNFIKFLAFIWLLFLIIFRRELILFLMFSIIFSVFFFVYSYFYIRRKLIDLFNDLDNNEFVNDLDKGEEKIAGLVCPACGSELTEYDEYCPECGLFLGKVKRKQPATRTGYFDKRIKYIFRKNDSLENS